MGQERGTRNPEEEEVEATVGDAFVVTLPFFTIITVILLFLKFFARLDSLVLAGILVGGPVSLHAFFCFLTAKRASFSSDQTIMLTKLLLLIYGSILIVIVIGHTLAVCFVDSFLRSSTNDQDYFVNVGLFTATISLAISAVILILVAKFRNQISRIYRMKELPESDLMMRAERRLEKARTRLGKEQFEAVSEEFHFVAKTYLKLEKWSKAAENYWQAAETLSREPNLSFGAAWLYGLSAATYLLDGKAEKAEEALKCGKETLETQVLDKKAKERVLRLFEFLTLIKNKDFQRAKENLPALSRKIKKQEYAVVDETIFLLERNLNG